MAGTWRFALAKSEQKKPEKAWGRGLLLYGSWALSPQNLWFSRDHPMLARIISAQFFHLFCSGWKVSVLPERAEAAKVQLQQL